MAVCCAVTAAAVAVVLCVVLFVCVLRGSGADKGVSTSGDDTRIEEDEKDASAAEEQDAEVRDSDGDYVRLDLDTIVGYQILDWNDDGNPEVFINVSGEPYIMEYLQ